VTVVARALGFALLALAYAAPVTARHSAVTIDATRATPGLQLTLIERPGAGPAASSTYRLTATGVPRGVLFGIWTKDFGQPFKPLMSGFRLNESGVLEMIDDAGQPRRLEDIVLDPGPYPRGAAWEVALVSADYAMLGVAKVMPHPIAARNGACGVSLELASRRGDRFIVAAQGFEPGEPLVVELQQATGTTQKRVSMPPRGGRMPLDVISHGAGSEHRARYTLKGRACEVAVDYTWGEAVPGRP
jgi:hypothetical protein